MMIIHKDGDLTLSPCNVIAHQANCQKTMGSGIADTIRKKMPEAYQADLDFPYSSKERLGMCSYGKSTEHKKFIFNLYGQEFYGRLPKLYTNYSALRTAVEMMMQEIEKIEKKFPKFKAVIGVPYKMGCDRAGGDWEIVEDILKETSDKYNRDIYIYKYDPRAKN